MIKTIKRLMIIVLSTICSVTLGVGIILASQKETPVLEDMNLKATMGTYNAEGDMQGEPQAQAEDGAYDAFGVKYVLSNDQTYMLIVVGIDDVDLYETMSLSISKEGESIDGIDLDNTYYTGISVKTGELETDVTVWTSEKFYPEGTQPEGLMVYELADYNKAYQYTITPSFTKKADGTTLSANRTVDVSDDLVTHTVNLTNGTFEDGSTTAEVVEGRALPDINWNDTIIGYKVNGEYYVGSRTFTMGTEDMTIEGVVMTGATNVLIRSETAYNATMNTNGTTSSYTKVGGLYGRKSVTHSTGLEGYRNTNVVSTANCSYSLLDKVVDGATTKSITLDAGTEVYITFVNENDETMKNVIFAIGGSLIHFGDVAAGEEVVGSMKITSAGKNCYIWWDAGVSYKISTYCYAISPEA